MNVERARASDTDALVRLRLAYLREDNGVLSAEDADAVRQGLPGYFRAHLEKDLLVFVAREEGEIVSCAFLLLVEKPMSPAFINGKTGIVLNVYTQPAFRHRGYAKEVMARLIEEARAQGLYVLELKATEEGYPLYRSVGFAEDESKYRPMRLRNP